MAKDIEDYVKGCAQCQQNKVNTHGIKAQYHPITTTAEALPFQTIALDFITKLTKSKGYDSHPLVKFGLLEGDWGVW